MVADDPSFSLTITSPSTTSSSALALLSEGDESGGLDASGCTGTRVSEQAATASEEAAARTAANRPVRGVRDIDDFLRGNVQHTRSDERAENEQRRTSLPVAQEIRKTA